MMPLDDRGLLLGDGLFETILAIDGDLVLFDEHIARMQASCAALGLPAPDADAAQKICELALGDTGMTSVRAAVRLTMTAGSGGRGLDRPAEPEPHIFATVALAPKPTHNVALLTSSIRRNESSPTSRHKTLSYIDGVMARREAAPSEALLLNTDGVIACAAAANVFWIREGVLFTPSLDCGILAGVMRGQVLQMAERFGLKSREGRFPPTALKEAEAMFITNSLIGIRRVYWLDGEDLPGLPIVLEMAEAMDEAMNALSSSS